MKSKRRAHSFGLTCSISIIVLVTALFVVLSTTACGSGERERTPDEVASILEAVFAPEFLTPVKMQAVGPQKQTLSINSMECHKIQPTIRELREDLAKTFENVKCGDRGETAWVEKVR